MTNWLLAAWARQGNWTARRFIAIEMGFWREAGRRSYFVILSSLDIRHFLDSEYQSLSA